MLNAPKFPSCRNDIRLKENSHYVTIMTLIGIFHQLELLAFSDSIHVISACYYVHEFNENKSFFYYSETCLEYLLVNSVVFE